MLLVSLVFPPMDGNPFCFHKPVDSSSYYNNVLLFKTIYVLKDSKNEVFCKKFTVKTRSGRCGFHRAKDFVHRASSADIQVKPQEGFFAPGLAAWHFWAKRSRLVELRYFRGFFDA